jgi:DDE superfamily endonuclease
MEELLDLYQRPYDPRRPLVCLDEKPVQLLAEARPPLPPAPGRPARHDYEYVRRGTANVFLAFEPLVAWRAVQVTGRRTAADFAEVVRWLVEEVHPEAEAIDLVVDNLNTHTPASLYRAFAPERARAIAARIAWHDTPKHGSWLNVAEIELAALARQCLGRRLGSAEELAGVAGPWEEGRNGRGVGVRWRFTTEDARIRLHQLYPSLQ